MIKAPQAKFSLFMLLNCIFSVNFRNFYDLENVRVRALKKCESESNIFFECESESESTKIVRVHRVRMRVRVRVYIPAIKFLSSLGFFLEGIRTGFVS